jgi:hypothetical protein
MSYWTDRFLDEPTVWWTPPERDGLGGYVWSSPTEIMARWQFSVGRVGASLEYLQEGGVSPFRTSVWTSISVELGSYLWKGLASEVGPIEIESIARQVVAVSEVRSIPTHNYLYKVYLDEYTT